MLFFVGCMHINIDDRQTELETKVRELQQTLQDTEKRSEEVVFMLSRKEIH